MKITPAYAAAAVIAVAVIAVAALLLASGAPPSVPGVSVTGVPGAGAATAPAGEVELSGDGLLLVGVKDRPIGSAFGNITGIRLTVSKITVHFASAKVKPDEANRDEDANVSEEEDAAPEAAPEAPGKPGWITVFEGRKTFNLLDYMDNVLGILGDANLSAGKYTEIRLYLARSVIEFNGAPDGAGATVYRLTVHNNVLKIKNGFIVRPDTALLLTLDFDANKSVSVDPDGNFVLKPVIKLLKKEHQSHTKENVKNALRDEGTEAVDIG